jgi:hypothetical protein
MDSAGLVSVVHHPEAVQHQVRGAVRRELKTPRKDEIQPAPTMRAGELVDGAPAQEPGGVNSGNRVGCLIAQGLRLHGTRLLGVRVIDIELREATVGAQHHR